MTNKEAIRRIREHMVIHKLNEPQAIRISEALEMAIEALERPQGEWGYTTHYARRYRVCPICTAEKEDDRSAGWNFCWHCGADMRGDKK